MPRLMLGEAGPETVERPQLLDVDMDAVPLCESSDGCEREAVWVIRKACGCPVLFCEPCRVKHWRMILEAEYEARQDLIGGLDEITAHCQACGYVTLLDPSRPLCPQMVVAVIAL